MEPKQYNKLVSITKKKQTQRYRDTKQWLPVGRRRKQTQRYRDTKQWLPVGRRRRAGERQG